MPTEIIVAVADQFYRDVSKLQKRYPNILNDVRELRVQLATGEKHGDRLQGLESSAYKVRVKNSDARRGKRGGYRVIYYLETADQVILITIYSKSDQGDVPLAKLRRFINEYQQKK